MLLVEGVLRIRCAKRVGVYCVKFTLGTGNAVVIKNGHRPCLLRAHCVLERILYWIIYWKGLLAK